MEDGAKVPQNSVRHAMLSSHQVHSHLNKVRVIIWRKKKDNMKWQSSTQLPAQPAAGREEEGSLEITIQIALQENGQEPEIDESMTF